MVMWFLFEFTIFLIVELVGFYPCNFSIIAFVLPILCWRGVFCVSVLFPTFTPPVWHVPLFSFASCWYLCLFPSNSIQDYRKTQSTKFVTKSLYLNFCTHTAYKNGYDIEVTLEKEALMQISWCVSQFPLSIISKKGFFCPYRILECWILQKV